MGTTKIKIEFDGMKKEALEFYTKEKGLDLTKLMQEKMDELYEQHVPSQTKSFVNHFSAAEPSGATETASATTTQRRRGRTARATQTEPVAEVQAEIGQRME